MLAEKAADLILQQRAQLRAAIYAQMGVPPPVHAPMPAAAA